MAHRFLLTVVLAAFASVLASFSAMAQQGVEANPRGPVNLKQPAGPLGADSVSARTASGTRVAANQPPNEFDSFVQRNAPGVQRFGVDLLTGTEARSAEEVSPLVPADYLILPGDEILLTLWGSVDADMRLVVGRSGNVNIPRVGAVKVAGVRHADLPDVIGRRIGLVFKNFQFSVTLGQLRGVRIFVTGFVPKPGAYNVSSLSTLTQALFAAGGPSASGSYRNIELRRAGVTRLRYDLYDLLLTGDRTGDLIVQPDDVIFVGPIGPQAALVGSVNRPAIFELKAGDTLADVLRMAGGFSTVADRSRLAVERLDDRSTARVTQIDLPAGAATALRSGDVLRAFSSVATVLPVERQTKRVRVEGEVVKPGDYLLPPGSSLQEALAAAGGLTPAAFVFGAEFNRESVRQTQQQNYDRALRDLEIESTKNAHAQRIASVDEAASVRARVESTAQLVSRLSAIKPSGRVVLPVEPESRGLPDLVLEDGDRLYIPPRPTSVGVFGSVYNAGSYLWARGSTARDYLSMAGGPSLSADASSVFMIRANGSVISARQNRGALGMGGGIDRVVSVPGDTIFMPDELNRTTFMQDLKDITQVIYQLGLGAAAFVAVSK
ncbi:MAG: hypothetical protein RLZZ598_1089 [Pseudomonadota bacterium]|jgi:protein involved in polysaccharide export with SLBB domain